MTSRTEIAKYRKGNLLLKKEIEERTDKTVEQLYAERAKRVRDAIELKEPDRVPFMLYCNQLESMAGTKISCSKGFDRAWETQTVSSNHQHFALGRGTGPSILAAFFNIARNQICPGSWS
jgi:hypothetical protein